MKQITNQGIDVNPIDKGFGFENRVNARVHFDGRKVLKFEGHLRDLYLVHAKNSVKTSGLCPESPKRYSLKLDLSGVWWVLSPLGNSARRKAQNCCESNSGAVVIDCVSGFHSANLTTVRANTQCSKNYFVSNVLWR